MSTNTQPQVVHIIDSAVNGVKQITELCRNGYVLELVECFNVTSMLKAILVLENPKSDAPAS